MKKHILASLCLFSLLNGKKERSTPREAREWDAQTYAQGNKIQEMESLHFLQESGLDFIHKKVLDVGCGTGNISAKIAEKAELVHGIDASKNMIEYAQKAYEGIPNLSFEYCFAEDLTPKETYDTAVTFFCVHWIKDKNKAFTKINRALKENGDFFGTYQSTSDPEPLHLTVFKEILSTASTILPFVKGINEKQSVDFFVVSDEEFKNVLKNNGFEMISCEQKSMDITMDKKEIENSLYPIVMSRPFMHKMPHRAQKWFFNYFFDHYLAKLIPTQDGRYIIPGGICTTVFHARKIAEIN